MKVSVEIRIVTSEGDDNTYQSFESYKKEVEEFIENELNNFLENNNQANHSIQPQVTSWPDYETREYKIEGLNHSITFNIRN